GARSRGRAVTAGSVAVLAACSRRGRPAGETPALLSAGPLKRASVRNLSVELAGVIGRIRDLRAGTRVVCRGVATGWRVRAEAAVPAAEVTQVIDTLQRKRQ